MVTASLPHYYYALRPFASEFREGVPILTYHHVGLQTPGARLKGLFVSPKLFNRQMTELKQAGFTAPEFSATGFNHSAANGNGSGLRRVFLTFDDGFTDTMKHALPVLNTMGFRGIQFLVSGLLGKTNEWQQRAGDSTEQLMDASQVREWIAAGQAIGSHTVSHPWLTRIPVEQAREQIQASKKALEDTFGVPVRHFCYPFGDWNKIVRDLVIEAGYETACTTAQGINREGDNLFELRRFMARYRSRSLKSWWRRFSPLRVFQMLPA